MNQSRQTPRRLSVLCVHGVEALSQLLKSYREAVALNASKGRRLDQRLLAEASELNQSLQEYATQRAALASCIRTVKFGAQGGAVWDAMAEGATSSRVTRASRAEPSSTLRPLIAATLSDLARHKFGFDESRGLQYEPGVDSDLDLLVRMDIERLDISLREAAPWAGKEPEMRIEICALFELVADFAPIVASAAGAH